MPQGCLAYTDTYLVFFNSSSDNASTAIYTASHSSTNIKFDGAANLTDFVLAKFCAFYSPYVYLVGTTTTFSSTSSIGDTQRNIDTATSVPAKIGSAAPPTPTSWTATGSSLVKRAEPSPMVRIYDVTKITDWSSPGQAVADIILSGETDASSFTTVAPIVIQDGGSGSHCVALTNGTDIKAFCDTLSSPLSQPMPEQISTPVRLVSFPGNTTYLMALGQTSESTVALGTSTSFQSLGTWQTNSFSETVPYDAAIVPLDRGSSQPELVLGTSTYLSYLRFGESQPVNETVPLSTSSPWIATYLALDNPTNPQKFFLVGISHGRSLQGISGETSAFLTSSTTDAGGTPASSETSAAANGSDSSNKTGVIAGAVVGSVVGAALIIGLLVWFLCRRRRRRSDRPADFHIVDGEKGERELPLLSLLSTVPRVQQLHVNPDELESLEPDATSSSVLEKMGYQLGSEPAIFHNNQHARRSITKNGNVYTLHYFSYTAQDAFMRNVKTMGTARSNRFVKQYDAFDLNIPTPRGGFRFLWITSPCIPNHSLDHVLDPNTYAPVDPHDFAFKAWSVFAMLEAVRDLHSHRIVHMSISPACFYYENAETVSDWQLGDFDQAAFGGEVATNPRLNACSPPEMLTSAMSIKRRTYHRLPVSREMDIWSLGCVIYQVATGKPFQMDLKHLEARIATACQEAGAIDHTFRVLLERMLQVDPVKRDTAENLAAYWKQANGLEDDD